ncbi:hypothetical protein [Anditalea andensis]|uniref:Uncharacterized protein n=1 Tax=Anditalea andensis TaxID=1048983 RepID=A0A074KYS4_9BACT|nr:hypothetical protein [Anditalea andensis]KEO72778.1 hypothetical protein EL17_14170 [Anditalea andensis]
MIRNLLSIAILCLIYWEAVPQVKTEKVQKDQIPVKTNYSRSNSYDLNFQNKEKINEELENELLDKNKEKTSYVFAKFADLNIDFKNIEGICDEKNCFYEIEVTSKGSNIIGILFKKIKLSKNSKLYIINDKENYLQGPLTAETISKTDNFNSPPMPGETIRIVLQEPIEEKKKSEIVISKASHGIIDMYGTNNYKSSAQQSGSCYGFGCSAPCNSNIVCWPSLDLSSKGVALIIYQSEYSDSVSYHGSGFLLNNGRQENSPIILTPNHTFGGYMIEHSQFMFHFRSPSCSLTSSGPMNIVAYGADPLSNINLTSNTDSRLLEIKPNQLNRSVFDNNPVSYLGWSIIDQPITSTLGIHHPRADVQKYISGGVPTKDDLLTMPILHGELLCKMGH